MKFGEPLQRGRVDLLFDKNPLNSVTLESTGGLWQLQINPTVTGEAVLNVSHRDVRGEYLVAYYLGENATTLFMSFYLVKRVMELLPEEIDPNEFRRTMPEHSTVIDHGWQRLRRPITTDPALVRRLGELAGLDRGDVDTLVGLICDAATAEGETSDVRP